MSRPMILDLFSGAGGAGMGYHRAGFDVVGIDVEPQPNYPFRFIEGDALDVSLWPSGLSAIHASPPCQIHSVQTPGHRRAAHLDLIPETRRLLVDAGLPFVIENVEGARRSMVRPVVLYGSSFGLDVRRHRLFETNWSLLGEPCMHGWQTPRFRSLNIGQARRGRESGVVGVHGHLNYPGEQAVREAAMGIDWMSVRELALAIPPVYTRFIGSQLVKVLNQ